MDRKIIFYHSPQSRSGGVRILLEELGADYDMHVLSLKAGDQRQAGYMAINPMGKVPAIAHNGALVTEQGAIYLYLSELYPEAGLAPGIGDPLRGPFLRWLFFYGSCFEPALVDRAMLREPARPSMCPYGDYDTMMKTLTDQLARGPYLLGEKITAADLLWGTALQWTTSFKLVAETPLIMSYIECIRNRPAVQRATASDNELAARQEAAAKSAS